MLIFEGILLLAGMYALIKGNFKWFNNKTIQGSRARIIGGILLLPIPVDLTTTVITGSSKSFLDLGFVSLFVTLFVIGVAVLLAVTAPDTGEPITPSSLYLMSILDSASKSKQVEEKLDTGLATQDTCHFCHRPVTERSGGLTVSGSGSDIFDLLSQMSARKFVCPSCSSVFCLECGNKKGESLGTGSTHCPKCGTKVL